MTSIEAQANQVVDEVRGVSPAAQVSRVPVARSMSDPARLWMLAFGVMAATCIWVMVYLIALSPFFEARAQVVRYGDLRQTLALQTAPIGGLIAPGTPVALVSIPAIGVHDVVVSEGTSSSDLQYGPGHRRDTPLPGQIGTSVLFAKGATFGGPFRNLDKLRASDLITVTTGQGAFTYQIHGVRKAGDPLPPPPASGSGRLVLVSAFGDGPLGNYAPSGLIFVDADLKSPAQQFPAQHPSMVPESESAFSGDSSGILNLCLSLPLLIAGLVVVVWMRQRWGGWQAWIVGLPIILAGAWLSGLAAAALLPNLY
jgi:sortase A